MNILESYSIESPTSSIEECAKFTIEDILSPFILHNITAPDQNYTFSAWIKSEAPSYIHIRGCSIPTSTTWTRHAVTFKAIEVNVEMFFNDVGTYYIYHPKLEMGTNDTDWTEASEDITERIGEAQKTADAATVMAAATTERVANAESLIQQLNDSISMLVTDGKGVSLMQQTASGGWTYSMGTVEDTINNISSLLSNLQGELGTTDATVEKLSNSLKDVESSLEWIKITTYEDEPCIALGETDSDFKLLITNTRIMFLEGSSVPAYISNQALHIKKAVIEEEFQQGNYVWKIRSNGNMGLIWKG